LESAETFQKLFFIFRTTDPQKGWDGTIKGQAAGTAAFVYVIHYIDLAGRSKYFKGLVSLIK
jgi:hypothetical protein